MYVRVTRVFLPRLMGIWPCYNSIIVKLHTQVGAGVHHLGVPGHSDGMSGGGASRGDQENDFQRHHHAGARHVETVVQASGVEIFQSAIFPVSIKGK